MQWLVLEIGESFYEGRVQRGLLLTDNNIFDQPVRIAVQTNLLLRVEERDWPSSLDFNNNRLRICPPLTTTIIKRIKNCGPQVRVMTVFFLANLAAVAIRIDIFN